MRLKTTLLVTCMSLGGALWAAGAQAQTSPLSGKVSSAEEGLMEGVLVSAKKEGSTITETVVTNEKGEFSFPAGKLEPGKYNITIRAGGYTLVGPKDVNEKIGLARAEAVKKYLYEQHQIPLFKMNVISYGEDKPVAPNNTKDGRAQNRRVVIRILA